jgi:lysophospholipase L1-like esterase
MQKTADAGTPYNCRMVHVGREDGVHPNDAGYKLLAGTVARALKSR